MSYVVVAIWTAQAGHEDEVGQILQEMIPLSRAEPATEEYRVQRSVDNPCVFLLYEVYTDPAGYQAHMSTPHFEQKVKGQAIPLLESRERTFWETL